MNAENTNPLGNAAVVAEKDPKAALECALEEMTLVLQVQARDALLTLASLSDSLAKKGEEIIKKTAEVSILYASGAIDKDSASLAVDNYIAALTLLGATEVNVLKVQAYIKAVKTLQAVKSILLALIQVGLNMVIPSLGTWVGGLNLTSLVEKVIPKPK